MRIYTRTGDGGETGLSGGARVPKDSARVEAYGTVDELNAHLGAAHALLEDDDLRDILARVQDELFDLGSDLASPPPPRSPRAQGEGEERSRKRPVPRITAEQVSALEREIDSLEAGVEPLRQFILPGGAAAAAVLHVARAVCRRAERRTVALSRAEAINPEALRYLNRLSDLLFVMARAVNARRGVTEPAWHAGE